MGCATAGGFNANRNQIVLKTPIKSLGLHEVPVQLHPEIEAPITVNVARSAAEAERQAKGEAINAVEEATMDDLFALFREHGDGILILTNSSNGEGIFKPLIDALLGPTNFPFEWENYTPYDRLPPLPKLKEHKPVTLTETQLSRLAGKYALSDEVGVTVTVENGHLFLQENGQPKQEYLPESPNDFYSTASSDECTFNPADPNPAQMLVIHLEGRDLELKRIP